MIGAPPGNGRPGSAALRCVTAQSGTDRAAATLSSVSPACASTICPPSQSSIGASAGTFRRIGSAAPLPPPSRRPRIFFDQLPMQRAELFDVQVVHVVVPDEVVAGEGALEPFGTCTSPAPSTLRDVKTLM